MKTRLVWGIVLLIGVMIGGVGWLTRLPSPLFSNDYSTVIIDENGEYLRFFLNSKEQWIFPPNQRPLPEKLVTSVINFEDKRFYDHHGIDFLALSRALWQNISHLDKISGASTITMQVARLVKPKERTIISKLIEMVQAIKLELRYDKEEILRKYLTHAPYGSNIIGYQAASLRYFGKSPQQLTWAEAATLAVLPNNPGTVNPMNNPRLLRKKRDRLLKSFYEVGIISKTTYQLAQAEGVPKGQIPFDLSAPHLARRLKNEYKENIIKTTISKKLQDRVNSMVQEHIRVMEQQGINNGAVLVAKSQSGEVKAYVGSNDFFDNQSSGKIDGVFIERSTGSILKPFLYALAMDKGMIIPESQIEDIPRSYGAYSPYNANYKFSGIVTVREALTRSLNAPAVAVLDSYGVDKFYNFLKEAGLTTLFRSADEYGLPLVLGGAEANLWDIASLYRGLGNYGRFSKVHVVKDKQNWDKKELISKGAAYLTLDIIKDLKRPGSEYFWKEYASKWKIAWKTGTSYGNRDAWAVGVSPEWTIAVWIGNFDGKESKSLSGIRAAAPLLFRIFNSLEKDYTKDWFTKPSNDLERIKVSAHTGYRSKEEGIELIEVDRPKFAKPLRFSPYERMIYVNNEETQEVCSLCWQQGDIKKVFKVIYPPDVIEFLKGRGNDFYTVPPHRKSCPTISTNNPIKFIYPQEGSIILIPRGIEDQYQEITMKVAHSQKESKLFWYIDDKYLGDTLNQHQKMIVLESGWHRLHVVDEEGHYKEIKFYTEKKTR